MSSSFDVKSLPLHRQIALGGGLLLFIVLFFPWVTYGVEGFGGSVSGWNGIGGFAGFFVIVLVAWEVLRVLGQVSQITINHDLITAGLGGLVALFGLIQFLRSLGYDSAFTSPGFGAFLILLISIGLGYGAFLAFNAAGGQSAIKDAQSKLQSEDGQSAESDAPAAPGSDTANGDKAGEGETGPGDAMR